MNGAIIVAAGSGKRLGRNVPKAFVELGNKPILKYSIEVFAGHPDISEIVVVVPPDFRDIANELISSWGFQKITAIIPGGNLRQESVYDGLLSLDPVTRNVLIHDAARPFISNNLISRLIRALKENAAVIPVIPLKDTLKRVQAEGEELAFETNMTLETNLTLKNSLTIETSYTIESTPDRSNYYLAQTPQAFDVATISEAHEHARIMQIEGTDDAMLVELLGKKVNAIMGEEKNLKITTEKDLQYAEFILKSGLFLDSGGS